ncbi:hypothetical protein DPMN_157489 [Dreissena polymorpha]|uniref:Uncharacterized protein n=1 Tax=Dreissena polymorpha TaxID=45954 RepID=A0A9D4INS6_DREPO|nr:hypothetical protein DPMN_157345 [Dreissena polymorpha]KAH3779684.1 hypothetical protein DPMN_157489 [Dreissena polymorpha]
MDTYSPTVDIDPIWESEVRSGGQLYPGYPMPMYPGVYPGSWQPGHYYPDAWKLDGRARELYVLAHTANAAGIWGYATGGARMGYNE